MGDATEWAARTAGKSPTLGGSGAIERIEAAGLVGLRPAVFVDDDERGDAAQSFDQLQAFLGPENADRRGQGVGRGAIGRQYADAAVLGQPQPGVRIENVRIARAVDFDILPGVAGRGDAAVGEQQDAAGGRLGAERRSADPMISNRRANAAPGASILTSPSSSLKWPASSVRRTPSRSPNRSQT